MKTLQSVLFKASVIFLLLFIITISPANADSKKDKYLITSIDVNLASYHFKSRDLNQVNLGLGATKELDHYWLISSGFYNNSYEKTSVYALVGLKHDMKNWRFGIDTGFVSGYDNIAKSNTSTTCINTTVTANSKYRRKQCNTLTTGNNLTNLDKYVFVVLPTVSWLITKEHAIKFSVIPPFGKTQETVLTAQYQYTL